MVWHASFSAGNCDVVTSPLTHAQTQLYYFIDLNSLGRPAPTGQYLPPVKLPVSQFPCSVIWIYHFWNEIPMWCCRWEKTVELRRELSSVESKEEGRKRRASLPGGFIMLDLVHTCPHNQSDSWWRERRRRPRLKSKKMGKFCREIDTLFGGGTQRGLRVVVSRRALNWKALAFEFSWNPVGKIADLRRAKSAGRYGDFLNCSFGWFGDV